MEQTFSDMSVQMAVVRAGASELVLMVAKDVHDVLRPNEFVLEFADTTCPGFHSALAVTNYRMLIGVGPGQLQEIAVDSVTRVDAVRAPEVTLLVRVYNADVTVYGLGDRGLRRIFHAFNWIVSQNAARPAHADPENSIADMYNEWIDVQRFLHENPDVSDEEGNQRLAGMVANKRWW